MAKQLSENHALLALLGNYEDEENFYGDKPKAKKGNEKKKESSYSSQLRVTFVSDRSLSSIIITIKTEIFQVGNS